MFVPFFSVVIPCYRCTTYVNRALRSLELQAYRNFEVILVDDASPDDTYEHLLKYRDTSSLNITLLRNEKNVGPGLSRNNGIRMAKGKYITFMDSDDWYEIDFLFSLHEDILRDKSDLIFFDFYRSYDANRRKSISCTKNLIGLDDQCSIAALCFDSLCTLCVKKEIFEEVEIPHLYNAEDVVTVPILVSKASKISILRKPLYNYFYRNGSLSSSKNKSIVYSFLNAFFHLKNSLSLNYIDAVEYKGIIIVLYGCVFKSLQSGFSFKEISNLIDQFVVLYPNWFGNKYLKYLPLRKKFFLKLVQGKYFMILLLYVRLQFVLLNVPRVFSLLLKK